MCIVLRTCRAKNNLLIFIQNALGVFNFTNLWEADFILNDYNVYPTLYNLKIPLRIGFKFLEISSLSTPWSKHSSKCSDI